LRCSVHAPAGVPRREVAMQTILLVDDRDDTCEAYAVLLRMEGYTVICAKNGHEACSLALDLLPDLVVMDLQMPVLSGWAAARMLRADARTAEIPIAALSAFANPDEVDSGHQACRFDAVWQKPFTPSELLAGAGRLLAQRASRAPRPGPRSLGSPGGFTDAAPSVAHS
jgi:two-component system, cell cycle response regulator DivK